VEFIETISTNASKQLTIAIHYNLYIHNAHELTTVLL